MRTYPALRCLTALSILFFTLTGSLGQPAPVSAQGSVAGFVVSPTSELTTSEAGLNAEFTIVLTAAPILDEVVTIDLISTNPEEGLPSSARLTFDEFNWDQPQSVTVTGQDDLVNDGDIAYSITTLPAESNLPISDYAGQNPNDVNLTNLDNDSPGYIITPLSGLITNEAGQIDSFTVKLTSRPLGDVTLSLASSDSSEGLVTPDSFTFTPTDWQTVQTATLTGQDDLLFDNDQNYTILITANSSDPDYQTNPPDVSARNLDDEQAVVSTQSDSYTTDQGQTLSQAAPGVLGNDLTNNGSLTAELFDAAVHGAITLYGDGSFVYTPDNGYYGPDSFTYTASNGTVTSSVTTVSLTVRQVVVVTVTTQPDSYSTNQDTTFLLPSPGVLINDTTSSGFLTAELVDTVTHGTITLNGNGSFVYTPNEGYYGPDAFTYIATNGAVSSPATTVSLTVNQVVVITVTAQPDSYSLNSDQTFGQAASGVLTNDITNGQALIAELATDVFHGTLTLNANGSFVYTPDPGYTGPDSFTYIARSGSVASSATLVSLTVLLVNLPPTAANDYYTTFATNSSPLVMPAPGLLANDTDPEALPLTASLFTQPNQGSISINPNGSFTYTPPVGFVGVVSFTYKATDRGGKNANATVEIEVKLEGQGDVTPPPPLIWQNPGVNGSVNHFTSSGTMRLEVSLAAGVTDVARVVFYRWDAPSNRRIELGSRTSAPYTYTLNATTVNFQWNQIDAAAFDAAGNRSELQHIWVVRDLLDKLFLAFIRH